MRAQQQAEKGFAVAATSIVDPTTMVRQEAAVGTMAASEKARAVSQLPTLQRGLYLDLCSKEGSSSLHCTQCWHDAVWGLQGKQGHSATEVSQVVRLVASDRAPHVVVEQWQVRDSLCGLQHKEASAGSRQVQPPDTPPGGASYLFSGSQPTMGETL
ncbi:UNVERIFIED_CONTAM: hypothetical protein K2H54_037657, partial [Gekko kuhli]